MSSSYPNNLVFLKLLIILIFITFLLTSISITPKKNLKNQTNDLNSTNENITFFKQKIEDKCFLNDSKCLLFYLREDFSLTLDTSKCRNITNLDYREKCLELYYDYKIDLNDEEKELTSSDNDQIECLDDKICLDKVTFLDFNKTEFNCNMFVSQNYYTDCNFYLESKKIIDEGNFNYFCDNLFTADFQNLCIEYFDEVIEN